LELAPQYEEEVLPASQREERLRIKWWINRAVKDEATGGLKPMYALYGSREEEFLSSSE
jgi:hypothetical protein